MDAMNALKRLPFVAGIAALLFLSSSGLAKAETPNFLDGNKLVTYLREFEKSERSDPSVVWYLSGIFEGYVVAIADCAYRKFHLQPKAAGT